MENYIFGSETRSEYGVACEQALRGALAAGREKNGKLETTSLEFDYLHRKRRCEMLIGGDDISNDAITLGTCFSMFVYTRARFRFVLIGGNLTAQSTKRHRGTEVRIQSPGTLLQALLPFPARPPEGIGELARRLDMENRAAHPQLRIHRNSPPPLPPAKLLPVSHFYPSRLGCLLLATS